MIQDLYACSILPVITKPDPKNSVLLAKTLLNGGIYGMIVSIDSDSDIDALREIHTHCPDMLVGAAVGSARQAEEAYRAGACFLVLTQPQDSAIRFAGGNGVLLIPSCVSAQELRATVEEGFSCVCCATASEELLKTAAELGIRLLLIAEERPAWLEDLLAHPSILAAGGEWLIPQGIIAASDFQGAARLAETAVRGMLGLELAHVGINQASARSAAQAATQLCSLLALPYHKGKGSSFAGTIVEVMEPPFWGTVGHIALYTNCFERSLAYLERRGVRFNSGSIKYDEYGQPVVIYTTDEIEGFVFHLLKK